MAPDREACEIMKTILDGRLKMKEAIQKSREIVKKISSLRIQLKYGIVNFGDFIAGELLSAVQAVAASVVDSLLGSASGLMKKLLEQMISKLVTVFLSAPEYVYALIAFPLDGARQATIRERMLLAQAEEHYNTMNQIVAKWLSKEVGRTSFYTQMRNALGYIQKSIRDIERMIVDLEGTDGYQTDKDARNAYFNEGVFKRIQTNILIAAEITKPQSNIDKVLGISRGITDAQNRVRSKAVSDVNRAFDAKKKINNAERTAAILELNRNTNINISVDGTSSVNEALENTAKNVMADLQRKRINERWASKNELFERERQTQISVAETAASTMFNPRDVTTSIAGNVKAMKEEFKEDMELLASSAKEYMRKIVRAYLNNKASQLMSNSCYTIRDLISKLIQELLKVIREVGNASSKTILFGLNNAASMLEVVDESFSEHVKSFKEGGDVSPARMASDLASGHGLIVSSSALLNSTVTESLIKLINADDELFAADVSMGRFMSALERIPDWDDRKKIWAVSPLETSVLNPYIQLLADSTKASLMLAIYLGTGSIGSRKAKSLINDISKKFRFVKKHNEIVLSTLYSYEPMVGSEITDMMNSLKISGLFAAFAATMSLTSLIRNIVNRDAATSSAATEYTDAITYFNCKAFYPDLFEDPKDDELVKGEAYELQETQPKGWTEPEKESLEKIEATRLATAAQVEITDFTPTNNLEDFQK